MSNSTVGDAAIAVVRRNTEEVQGKGNLDLFEELFADDFVDHTPQPGTTSDKDGVRVLYKGLRAAFPDFRPEIHWQVAAGDLVTTYKTYHGTHQGAFLSNPLTFNTVSTSWGTVTPKSRRTRQRPRCPRSRRGGIPRGIPIW
jgi:SnoaL-like polyketide cyclase